MEENAERETNRDLMTNGLIIVGALWVVQMGMGVYYKFISPNEKPKPALIQTAPIEKPKNPLPEALPTSTQSQKSNSNQP